MVRSSQIAAAIAASASGFSSEERSPGSSPRTAARNERRTIFADRVFGSARRVRVRDDLGGRPPDHVAHDGAATCGGLLVLANLAPTNLRRGGDADEGEAFRPAEQEVVDAGGGVVRP